MNIKNKAHIKLLKIPEWENDQSSDEEHDGKGNKQEVT